MKNKGMIKLLAIILALIGVYLIALSFGSGKTIKEQPTPVTLHFSKVDIQAKLLSVDPDALDQLQDDMTGVNLGAGTFHVAQGVINDRSPLTAFCVCVARIGMPEDPLYIGIMDSLKDPRYGENYLVLGELTSDILPQENKFYWVTLELSSPLDIPAGQKFYIVMISDDNPLDGDFWSMAGSTINPYNRGIAWRWTPENGWQPLGIPGEFQPGEYDMCFATYTVPGGGGGQPQISITYSSEVLTAIGVLSLLGAVVLFMRGL